MTKESVNTEKKYPVISESIGTGKQTAVFERIFSIGDKKLQITIKSDSYDFQSSAVIRVFSPEKLEWNFLHSIHYSNMQTPINLAYKTPNALHFELDAEMLTNIAEQILA